MTGSRKCLVKSLGREAKKAEGRLLIGCEDHNELWGWESSSGVERLPCMHEPRVWSHYHMCTCVHTHILTHTHTHTLTHTHSTNRNKGLCTNCTWLAQSEDMCFKVRFRVERMNWSFWWAKKSKQDTYPTFRPSGTWRWEEKHPPRDMSTEEAGSSMDSQVPVRVSSPNGKKKHVLQDTETPPGTTV